MSLFGFTGSEYEQIGRCSCCRTPCCWYVLWGYYSTSAFSFSHHKFSHQRTSLHFKTPNFVHYNCIFAHTPQRISKLFTKKVMISSS